MFYENHNYGPKLPFLWMAKLDDRKTVADFTYSLKILNDRIAGAPALSQLR